MKLEELSNYTKTLQTDYIVVTGVTKHFAKITYNWYESGKQVGISDAMCIFALDNEAHDYLESKGVPVFRWYNSDPDPNNNRAEWIELEKKYKFIIPLEVSVKLLKKKFINVILSDTDIVFLKNPIHKLKQEITGCNFACITDKRFDFFNTKRQKDKIITVQEKKYIKEWGTTDQSLYGEINGAFGCFPGTDQNLKFLNNFLDPQIIERFPKGVEAGAAQTMFNTLLKEHSIKTKILNPFEFPNGSIWEVPYLRKEIIDKAYLVHYNFISKDYDYELFPEKKIIKMKEDGFWLVD